MKLKTSLGNTPKEALLSALNKVEDKPIFAIVYGKISSDLPHLIKEAKNEIGNLPLIGATTGSGQFTETEFTQEKFVAGVVETNGDAQADTFIIRNLNKSTTEKNKELFQLLTKRAKEKGYPNHTIMILSDAFAISGDDLVDIIKETSGPFTRIAGGMAGDHQRFKETMVFYNGEVLSNAVVGASLYTRKKIGIGVKHGWKKLSTTPLKITRSQSNILYEINNKPALEVWKSTLESKGITVPNDKEGMLKTLLNYELGIETLTSSEPVVRVALDINPDGSLVLAGKAPEGRNAYIMQMTKESLYEGAKSSIESAIQSSDGKPSGLFVFSCVARLTNIGVSEYINEINAIKEKVKVPLIGFNTYGEIAKYTGEIVGFHNTTVVSMLLTD